MTDTGKIFGIGLSKTGTTSLYAALTMLGYQTVTARHMRKIGLKEWRSGDFATDYLAGIDAATDLPIGTYFRELDTRYPGSRFILTERPVDSWLASIEGQFGRQPDPVAQYRRDVRMATYGVSIFHAERFRRIMADHSCAVRDHFRDRPDQLLIQNYFAGDGWESLCRFLDRPVPAAPFPNVKPGWRPTPTGEARTAAGRTGPGKARHAKARATKTGSAKAREAKTRQAKT